MKSQTRLNDLEKVIRKLNPKDMGYEIEENSFVVIPRLWVDNGHMGFHVVVQVWDHTITSKENTWNFSLWLMDCFNDYPDTEDGFHCEIVCGLGTNWFTDRNSLIAIASEVASYHEKLLKK